MDLFEAIEKRYTHRGEFTSSVVPEEDLRKIAGAGLKAPSGKNLQTTSFVIVNEKEILDKIKSVLPNKSPIKTCNALIVCVIDKNPDDFYYGYNFQLEDCAASVQNMLLAITDLGYASVWLDGVLRIEGRGKKISKILNLPEDKKVQVILPIGVPVNEEPKEDRFPFEKRVWFNRFK
ncbi:MAG: nitroreductase family protein [Melioribacteraceae bacterium]|nr:nitroreductase family protein [Melioribacteraceae bacterium]